MAGEEGFVLVGLGRQWACLWNNNGVLRLKQPHLSFAPGKHTATPLAYR